MDEPSPGRAEQAAQERNEFRRHVELVRECMRDELIEDVNEFGVDKAMTLTSRLQSQGLLAAHPPTLDPNRVMSSITFLLGQARAARLGHTEVDADTVELAAQSMREALSEDVCGRRPAGLAARLRGAMFEMVQSVELAKIAEYAKTHDLQAVIDLLEHHSDMHYEIAINVDIKTGELYPDTEDDPS